MATATQSQSQAETIIQAFASLALAEGLHKKSKHYKERRRAFIAESVQDSFISQFGINTSNLQAWQHLCDIVLGSAETTQAGLKKCKAALAGIFINLVDLVDAANAGRPISRTFTSSKALARYIKSTGKVFPKSRAKANPLLRQFLIVVSA